MAEEVALAGTQARAKLRNPWGVLGLTLITLGIYWFFWWYYLNREMRDFGRARGVDLGQNPGNSVLAVTLGALIIIPAIVSMWTTSDRIQRTEETAGVDRPASGPIIFILLLLIGPVGIWYAQNELNKAWRAQASGAAATLPSSEASVQPAPPPPPAAPAEPRPEAPEQGPQSPS
jgi:4-amino-4-deoxy-L-arabinose transferase-like glycosyltransferase